MRSLWVIALVAGVAGPAAAAITQSVRDGGGATIQSAIAGTGVHTFAPATPYPTITASLVIDATTQTGYAGAPLIEINGANAGVGARGLWITTAFGNTINVT